MFSQFVTDILSEHIFEIGLGVSFFLLGVFVNRKVNNLIENKAKLEQKNKDAQCQRIIESLKDIQDRENKVKVTLNNYQIGNQTNDLSDFFMEAMVSNFNYKIGKMNNAIWQLQGKLNDPSLGEEFSEYLGWFNFLPTRILIDKIPQQARQQYEIDGVISGIDKQLEKIQAFIGRFTKEMPEKHEDKPISSGIDYSKYPNAPNLAIYVR